MNAVIELRGVRKNYGKVEVLKGINMSINKGDIYGLIGQNGAGKTTIFKLILGLSDFNNGEISILNSKDEKEKNKSRSKIGFLIGSNFFTYLSGKGNLEYYSRLKGCYSKEEIERVLGIVGLDKKAANMAVKKYSLGMKQRLGIANALLGKPEILILDEPTNGLDPQGILDIRNLIKKLNKEEGITIIVSSHILGELENTAHRFGIVHKGVIKDELTSDEILNRTGVTNIEVSDDDVEKAKKVLEENGIEIKKIAKNDNYLEDFYFGLVNGKEGK